MNIFNLRFGFATNSSSTHSIIIIPEDLPVPPTDEWSSFGWQYFTATDELSKRNYFLRLIKITIDQCVRESGLTHWKDGSDVGMYLMNTWFDFESLSEEEKSSFEEGYVDHESVFSFPRRWDGKNIHVEFAKAIIDLVIKSNIAILGGNDNDNEYHHFEGIGKSWEISDILGSVGKDTVVTYDDKYNFWTTFNRVSGTKVRFRLDSDESPIEKSSYPELVDIKITDMCPYACPFCYMGSTSEGLHGDTTVITGLISELASKNVFEIAIGGGEPTLHPDFVKILQHSRGAGIIPNFTTKNLAWLREPKLWIPIIKSCGAFAYSVDKKKDIDNLAALLNQNDISFSKANIQVIPETMRSWDLAAILKAAAYYGFSVTLLGYKTTGRGSEYEDKKTNCNWVSVVESLDKNEIPKIGIDTILAKNSDLEGVDKRLYTLEEGKFSMYIDAVELKVGPSSFADKSSFTCFGSKSSWQKGRLMLDYNGKWKDLIWQAFSSY